MCFDIAFKKADISISLSETVIKNVTIYNVNELKATCPQKRGDNHTIRNANIVLIRPNADPGMKQSGINNLVAVSLSGLC